MNKKTANEVAELYAECLREIYSRLGLTPPEVFEPFDEAIRIIAKANNFHAESTTASGLCLSYGDMKADREHSWRLSYIDRALQALALTHTGRETAATSLLEDHILPHLKENK